MQFSKKRKQQLSYVIARSLESRKHQKVDYKNQQKKEILKRQRQEKNYWDEYENYNSESSSNKSDCNKPSPDKPSSDEEEEEVIKDNGREKVTHEGLGVQLEIEKCTVKLI